MTRDRDDAEYWDALAERVAAGAVRPANTGALDWLAQSRTAGSAVLLIAAVAFGFAIFSASSSTRDENWTANLAPDDAVGKTIAAPERPPEIGALLLASRVGDTR